MNHFSNENIFVASAPNDRIFRTTIYIYTAIIPRKCARRTSDDEMRLFTLRLSQRRCTRYVLLYYYFLFQYKQSTEADTFVCVWGRKEVQKERELQRDEYKTSDNQPDGRRRRTLCIFIRCADFTAEIRLLRPNFRLNPTLLFHRNP